MLFNPSTFFSKDSVRSRCLQLFLPLIAIGLVLCTLSECPAQRFPATKDCSIFPPGGFDPLEPSNDLRNDLVEFQGEPVVAKNGQIRFAMQMVKSYRQYVNDRSVNASLHVGIGTFKGAAEVLESLHRSSTKHTLVYTLTVEYLFEKESPGTTLRLSQKGREFSKKNGPEKLVKVTGERIVSSVERGSRTTVHYTIECSSEEKRRIVERHLKANWSVNSADFSLRKVVAMIDKSAAVNLAVFHSRDIGFVKEIAELVNAEPGNLKTIISTIRTSCRNLVPKDCPVLYFTCKKIDTFPEVVAIGYECSQDDELNRKISESTIAYLQAEAKLGGQKRFLEEILSKIDQKDLVKNGESELRKQIDSVEKRQNKLKDERRKLTKCKMESEITLPAAIRSTNGIMKWIKTPLVEQQGWKTDVIRPISEPRTNWFIINIEHAPKLRIKYPFLISRFFVIRTDRQGKQERVFFTEEPRVIEKIAKQGRMTGDEWTKVYGNPEKECIGPKQLKEAIEYLTQVAIKAEAGTKYELYVEDFEGVRHAPVNMGNAKEQVTIVGRNPSTGQIGK